MSLLLKAQFSREGSPIDLDESRAGPSAGGSLGTLEDSSILTKGKWEFMLGCQEKQMANKDHISKKKKCTYSYI